MSIEKFNNEKTVTIETSKVDNQPNNLSDFLPKQKTAHFYKISNYFFALIIFVTILSVAKIPYCGSYLDAYIFEFLIGTYIKFLAYLFILLFCVAKIFSKWKFCQFITSKRSIIGWICILIAAILINTIIYEFTNANGTGTLSFNSFLHIGSLVKDYVNRFNLIVDKYINKFTPFV
jgi:hypothetical protein